MDFSWSDAQLATRTEVAEFGSSLNGGLAERERVGEFPMEAWKRCGEFGLLSMSVPGEYNATGRTTELTTAALAMEALGYGCRDNGLNLAIAAHMWAVAHPLAEHGTEQQKARYLPGMTDGTIIGAHAVSEEDAGSDAMSITSRATKVDGGYQLTGEKRYITLGPLADLALVFATTDPDKGRWGLTAFLVETASDGCIRGPVREKMGLRTVPMGSLEFTDCFVPEENRLGPEGAGASISGTALGVERCFVLATQVGTMDRQVEEAIEFATSRRQFGKPVGKFQSVSNRIVDMKLAVETSRLLLYKVAWLIEQGEESTLEAALLKLLLSESFVESSLSSIRTFGGAGYLTDNEVERDLRDAVGGLLYAGTNDIQRVVAARILGM